MAHFATNESALRQGLPFIINDSDCFVEIVHAWPHLPVTKIIWFAGPF
jgi:hypothetical protein